MEKVLEIVKKNLVSIICGVIAILAVVAWFVPLAGWYEELAADAKKRADVAGSINGLINQQRTQPLVMGSTPVPLLRFPNKAVIDEGAKTTALVKSQAYAALATAVEINRKGHDLLRPNALPHPDPPAKYEFRAAYNAVARPRPATPGASATTMPTGPGTETVASILHSSAPPTDQEIQAALNRKWELEYAPKVILVNGQPANMKQLQQDFLAATENFAEKFRRNSTQNFKTYMDVDALSIAPRMDPTITPTVEDIWYAQMTLWVEQDVARSIALMNEKSPNIQHSMVKHVMAIDLPPGITMYQTPGAAMALPSMAAAPAEGGDVPIDAGTAAAPTLGAGPAAGPAGPVDQPGVVPVRFDRSPSGRVCNYIYDVVRFNVVVVVDAGRVPEFLQMLEYGKLITALHIEMQTVDLARARDAGYDYGSTPVVQLAMQCEELFLRDWTARNLPNPDGTPGVGTPPMPLEVQRLLHIAP